MPACLDKAASIVTYYQISLGLILASYGAEVIELAQNNRRSAAAFFDDGHHDCLRHV